VDLRIETKDPRTQRYIQPRLSLRESNFSKLMFSASAPYITCSRWNCLKLKFSNQFLLASEFHYMIVYTVEIPTWIWIREKTVVQKKTHFPYFSTYPTTNSSLNILPWTPKFWIRRPYFRSKHRQVISCTRRTKSLSWNDIIYILVTTSVGRLQEFQKTAE
jgi:hypothetical protein